MAVVAVWCLVLLFSLPHTPTDTHTHSHILQRLVYTLKRAQNMVIYTPVSRIEATEIITEISKSALEVAHFLFLSELKRSLEH